eukprot:TRINITY_DN4819_c0_g1_i3.p1 TRINITY_DN4819_c0_g1~~TRINITY_DN4819_c0_g1_i3.p1  ORF type:complete len:507 (-),score=94.26 TRINITY_DN4819_c0_g1_i3:160-1680(-)
MVAFAWQLATVLLLSICASAFRVNEAKTILCEKEEEGVRCDGVIYEIREEPAAVFSDNWWIFFGGGVCCACCAAIAAGLTLGLTSLDSFELTVLCETLPEDVYPRAPPEVRERALTILHTDQEYAKRLLPFISRHYFDSGKNGPPHWLDPTNQHYLLVTLLFMNAAANEALPLFFNKLMPEWLAVLISISVVLLFGEIAPSAVFLGPNQLFLASKLTPLVRLVEIILWPLVWPVSLTLDKLLGHGEKAAYSKAQIKGLVRALRKQGSELMMEEANMIHGVLEMHQKTAKSIAHPIAKAKSLAEDTPLSQEVLDKISKWGHSRCFITKPGHPTDVRGVLLLKKLINVHTKGTADAPCVDSIPLKYPVLLHPNDTLLSTLEKFKAGSCHLAIVSDDPKSVLEAWKQQKPIPLHAQPIMFCSLEDVMEELLADEIFDEEDIEHGRDVDALSSASDENGRLFQQWRRRSSQYCREPIDSADIHQRRQSRKASVPTVRRPANNEGPRRGSR